MTRRSYTIFRNASPAPGARPSAATTASAAVPTVAVLPFRNLSGGKASVGEAIRETVTSDLKTLGGVRVVERAQLDRVLGEQHLQGGRRGRHGHGGARRQAHRRHAHRRRRLSAVGQRRAPDRALRAGRDRRDHRHRQGRRSRQRLLAPAGQGHRRALALGRHGSSTSRSPSGARAPLKSMRTLELYGDAVVAQNDEKKAELLKLAVAEDASFTYAATDLAALEKRMKQYEALSPAPSRTRRRARSSTVCQGEGSAEAGDDGGAGLQHAAAGAPLSHDRRRSRASLAAGPAARDDAGRGLASTSWRSITSSSRERAQAARRRAARRRGLLTPLPTSRYFTGVKA